MHSATSPRALLLCVEPAQDCTAGLISWQEPQNSGVEVATMAVMVPKKMGKAMMTPIITRTADKTTFFQAGFFLVAALFASFIDSPGSAVLSSGKILRPTAFTGKDKKNDYIAVRHCEIGLSTVIDK